MVSSDKSCLSFTYVYACQTILTVAMFLKFQFGFNMFPDIPRPLNTQYKCYSVSMLPGNERHDVERGGKSKLHILQHIQILIVFLRLSTVISCFVYIFDLHAFIIINN